MQNQSYQSYNKYFNRTSVLHKVNFSTEIVYDLLIPLIYKHLYWQIWAFHALPFRQPSELDSWRRTVQMSEIPGFGKYIIQFVFLIFKITARTERQIQSCGFLFSIRLFLLSDAFSWKLIAYSRFSNTTGKADSLVIGIFRVYCTFANTLSSALKLKKLQ